jgi:hypothetical protein
MRSKMRRYYAVTWDRRKNRRGGEAEHRGASCGISKRREEGRREKNQSGRIGILCFPLNRRKKQQGIDTC